MATAQGLTGLRDLYSQVVRPIDVGAEDRDQGTVSDPRHGTDHGGTYPWIDAPYQSAGNVMPQQSPTGMEDMTSSWILTAGSVDPDQSPAMNSHAAPYPRMGPETSGNLQDGVAEWNHQAERQQGHLVDQGSVRINTSQPGFGIEHGEWHQSYSNNPGQTDLTRNVPDQLRGSGGSGRDSTQGFGWDNGYGFGAPHIQYNQAVDGVPYNRQWINSAERPFIVPRRGVQATFDGGDSPYGAAGDTHANQQLGPSQAAVMTNPTAYRQPAAPNVDPVYSGGWSWAGW